MLTIKIRSILKGLLGTRESAQGRTNVEGGPLPQAGVQPSLEAATDGGETLWVAPGRAGPHSSGKPDTTCWGMESLLSWYFAETKMAAWNGCLAAGSFEYASFPELCKNQIPAGFFLAWAVRPAPMPEERVRWLSGVCVKPNFTIPVISKPLERDPTWCHLIPTHP